METKPVKKRMSKEFKGLLDLFRKEGLAYANNMLHMVETGELPYPKSTTKEAYYSLVSAVVEEYKLQLAEKQAAKNK